MPLPPGGSRCILYAASSLDRFYKRGFFMSSVHGKIILQLQLTTPGKVSVTLPDSTHLFPAILYTSSTCRKFTHQCSLIFLRLKIQTFLFHNKGTVHDSRIHGHNIFSQESQESQLQASHEENCDNSRRIARCKAIP